MSERNATKELKNLFEPLIRKAIADEVAYGSIKSEDFERICHRLINDMMTPFQRPALDEVDFNLYKKHV